MTLISSFFAIILAGCSAASGREIAKQPQPAAAVAKAKAKAKSEADHREVKQTRTKHQGQAKQAQGHRDEGGKPEGDHPEGAQPEGGHAGQRLRNIAPPPGIQPNALAPLEGQALDKARTSFKQTLKSLPKPDYLKKGLAQARKRRQAHARSGKKNEKAKPAPSNAKANAPTSASTDAPPLASQRSYAHARVAWESGRNFQAIQKLQKARRRAPNSPAILRLLGLIYTSSNNKVRGANYLQQALAIEPDDLRSVFLLGRFELQQQNWKNAAALLAHGMQVEAGQDAVLRDPATRPLLHYYLGVALGHAGYANAAVEQYRAYLDAPRSLSQATRRARELLFVDQSKALTWRSIGDLQLRLHKPAKALADYARAAKAEEATTAAGLGPSEPNTLDSPAKTDADADADAGAGAGAGADAGAGAGGESASASAFVSGLAKRRVYANLRLGRFSQARQIVIKQVRGHGEKSSTLALVRYLLKYTKPGQLANQLRQVYVNQGRPAALVLTISQLLPARQARPLLRKHIKANPDDNQVFKRLLEIIVSPNDATAKPDQAKGKPASAHAAGPNDTHAGENAENVQNAQNHVPAHARAEAAKVTLQLTADALDHAQAYGRILSQTLGSDRATLDAFKALAGSLKQQAAYHVLRGITLRHADRLDDAANAFAAALKANPKLTSVRMQQARLLIDQKHYDQAASLLEGLKVNQNDPAIVQLRVRALVENGHRRKALAILNQVLSPNAPAGATTATSGHENANKTIHANANGNANGQTAHTLKVGSDQRANLVIAKARVLLDMDEADRAEQTLLDALSAAPKQESYYAVLMELYRSDSSHYQDELRNLLQRMLSTIPNSRLARLTLAKLRFASGEFDKAEAVLTGLLAENPDDETSRRLLVELYQRTGRTQKAANLLEKMLKQRPDNFARARDLALLYRSTGEPGKAAALLKKRLKREHVEKPAALVSLLWRVMLEADKSSGKQAKRILERARKRFPHHAGDLGYEYSSLLTRLGEDKHARQVLEQTLKQAPHHAAANNALGYTLATENKDLKRAQHMVDTALDQDPQNAAYLDTKGWILYKRGKFKQAVKYLRKSQDRMGGDYPIIINHLADALYRLGRKAEATQSWQRGLKLLQQGQFGDDPEIKGLAAKLKKKVQAAQAHKSVTVAPIAEDAGN